MQIFLNAFGIILVMVSILALGGVGLIIFLSVKMRMKFQKEHQILCDQVSIEEFLGELLTAQYDLLAILVARYMEFPRDVSDYLYERATDNTLKDMYRKEIETHGYCPFRMEYTLRLMKSEVRKLKELIHAPDVLGLVWVKYKVTERASRLQFVSENPELQEKLKALSEEVKKMGESLKGVDPNTPKFRAAKNLLARELVILEYEMRQYSAKMKAQEELADYPDLLKT